MNNQQSQNNHNQPDPSRQGSNEPNDGIRAVAGVMAFSAIIIGGAFIAMGVFFGGSGLIKLGTTLCVVGLAVLVWCW